MSFETMRLVIMCSPDYYSVTYSINPWMQIGSVDTKKAVRQWKELVFILEALGVTVHKLNQEESLPDMVFTADHGVLLRDSFVLASFRYKQRQQEASIVSAWLEKSGLNIIHLSSNSTFEGGDCLSVGRWCFIGTGFRTNEVAVQELSTLTPNEVVGLSLCDERFYHLDTCLFPLNEEVAFYYPQAFSNSSLVQLQTCFPTLISLSEREALGFCANSVVIGKNVLVNSGNPTFVEKLEELGYQPIEIEISEFIKAGGGIHCLMLPFDSTQLESLNQQNHSAVNVSTRTTNGGTVYV